MKTHTLTLTQGELETIIDALGLQAHSARVGAETLTARSFAAYRESLEKDAATYHDLWDRLCEIAYPDNNERASK